MSRTLLIRSLTTRTSVQALSGSRILATAPLDPDGLGHLPLLDADIDAAVADHESVHIHLKGPDAAPLHTCRWSPGASTNLCLGDPDGVPTPAPEPTSARHVHGRVTRSDGSPVPAAHVQLLDRDFGADYSLGAARTDARGTYRIEYRPRATDRTPDVVVRVLADTGEVVVTSAVRVDAPADVTVDLGVPAKFRARPDYDVLLAFTFEAHKRAPYARWRAEDVELIAAKSGLSASMLTHLVSAHAIAAEHPEARPEAVFACLARGTARDWASLCDLQPADIPRTLREAVDAGLVGPDTAREAGPLLALVTDQAAAKLLHPDKKHPVEKAVRLLGLFSADARRLAGAWAETNGHPAGIRQRLASGAPLSRGGKKKIDLLLSTVDVVTDARLATSIAARVTGSGGTHDSPARWSREQWTAFLAEEDLPVPPDLDGSDDATRRQRYAERLYALYERAHPAVHLRATLARRAALPGASVPTRRLANLLEAHPTLDLTSSRADLDAALERAGVDDDSALAARAGRRLARLVGPQGRGEGIGRLLDANIHSGHALRRMGRAQAKLVLGGGADAEALVDRAWASAVGDAAVVATIFTEGMEWRNGMPWALGGSLLPEGAMARWTELFGSVGGCSCVHCRSVFSPAAYLFDLLEFIDGESTAGRQSGLEVLRSRRPDIEHIQLDCANSHTELPQIDLVNEQLESLVRWVSRGFPDPRPRPRAWPQTTWSAEELRAHPEHQDATAYAVLATEVFPWALPLDLPREEIRSQCALAGVSRLAILEGLARVPQLDDPDVEALGLLPGEVEIVTQTWFATGGANDALGRAWGVAGNPAAWARLATQPDDARAQGPLPDLLERSGLTLTELNEILALPTVALVPGAELWFDVECDLARARIVEPGTSRRISDQALVSLLRRLHGFERLRRRLGWNAAVLDRALQGAAGARFDDSGLRALGALVRLAQALGRPVEVCAEWFGTLPTRSATGDRSAYERVFVGEGVDPTSLDAGAFQLDADRTDLLTSTTWAELLVSNASTLRQASRLGAQDLETVVTEIGRTKPVSIESLSLLVRIGTLAQALGVTAAELVSLHRATQPDPAAPLGGFGVHVALELLSTVRLYKSSNLSIGELDYVRGGPTPRTRPSDGALADLAGRLGPAAGRESWVGPLAEVSGVAPAVAAALLDVFAPASTAPGAASVPPDTGTLRRLDRAALLVTRLGIESIEIAALSRALPPSWFSGAGAWAALARAIRLVALRQAVGDDWAATVTLAEAGDPTWPARLAEAADLDPADVDRLVMATTAQGPLDAMVTTAEAATFLRRVGLDAETALLVAQPVADAPRVTEAARSFARRRVARSQWAGAAATARDILRVRQRDALVSWLLLHLRPRGIHTPDELSAFLLLDVQVAPIVLSSRLRQAIGSVQLLVQRGILGIERNFQLDADRAPRWEWARTYRVWEAARKVFLYPENWIDPALLPEKSEIFRQFEQELSQADATSANAEAALGRYIDGLHRISNLEPVALCGGADGDEDLHILARTRNTPQEHYVRTWRRASDGCWSPWEKVPFDVASEHPVLQVWQGHLYLFAPALEEKSTTWADPTLKWNEGEDIELKYYDCQMSWSVRAPDGWTEPRSVNCEAFTDGFPTEVLTSKSGDATLQFWTVPLPTRAITFAASTRNGRPTDGSPLKVGATYVRRYGGEKREREDRNWFEEAAEGIASVVGLDGALTTLLGTGDYFSADLDRVGQAYTPTFRMVMPGGDLALYRGGAPVQSSEFPIGVMENDPFPVLQPQFLGPSLRAGVRLDVDGEGVAGVARWRFDEGEQVPWVSGMWQETVTLPDGREFLVETSSAPLAKARSEGVGRVLDPVDCMREALASEPRKVILHATTGSALLLRRHSPEEDVDDVRREFRKLLPRPGDVGGALDLGAVRAHLPGETVGSYTFVALSNPYADLFRSAFFRARADGLYGGSAEEVPARQQGIESAVDPWTRACLTFTERVPDASNLARAFHLDATLPNGLYHWEIFFHLPFLVARHLSANGRYEEARHWYHYIFNPTDHSETPSAPARYWQFRPFFEHPTSDPMALSLLDADADATDKAEIRAWLSAPFDPHAIAGLRTSAYQRAVFIGYLDNLVAWGDDLFRRDTRETIEEAAQLYLFVAALLGPRPERPERQPLEGKSHAELAAVWEGFSNAMVEIEDAITAPPNERGSAPSLRERIAESVRPGSLGGPTGPLFPNAATSVSSTGPTPPDPFGLGGALPSITSNGTTAPFFCIPPNARLDGYWDLIADRLFKVRNSLNIDGEYRALALYDPPLDPGLLVRAKAAGLSLADVVRGTNEVPNRRFAWLVAKALELTGELRGLAASLKGAIEQKEAEQLTVLRTRHERRLATLVRTTRGLQVSEARAQVQVSQQALESARRRERHYESLVDGGLSVGERLQVLLATEALRLRAGAVGFRIAAAALGAAPDVTGTASTTGKSVSTTVGGFQAHRISTSGADVAEQLAGVVAEGAGVAGLVASFQRRMEDWKLQRDLARRDVKQGEKSLLAAQVRVAISEQEERVQERQLADAEEVENFLRNKQINVDTYAAVVARLAHLYRAAYAIALGAARNAQTALGREIPALATQEFGLEQPWSSLTDSLMAAEALHHSVRRMEAAWIDKDKRRLEIVKHVSLIQLDAAALEDLRLFGVCTFLVPEWLFDLDFPGHYDRRLRSVAVTIPCVVGPFTSVNAILSLTRSWLRATPPDTLGSELSSETGPSEMIVVSGGREDAGLHEFNLRDERYLPFEGRGAVARWELRLASPLPQFNPSTIRDVVLHLRYTALAGAGSGGAAVLPSAAGGLTRSVSARRDAADSWAKWVREGGALRIPMTEAQWPYWTRGGTVSVTGARVVIAGTSSNLEALDSVRVTVAGNTPHTLVAAREASLTGLGVGERVWYSLEIAAFAGSANGTWELTLDLDEDQRQSIDDVTLLLSATVSGRGGSPDRAPVLAPDPARG